MSLLELVSVFSRGLKQMEGPILATGVKIGTWTISRSKRVLLGGCSSSIG